MNGKYNKDSITNFVAICKITNPLEKVMFNGEINVVYLDYKTEKECIEKMKESKQYKEFTILKTVGHFNLKTIIEQV